MTTVSLKSAEILTSRVIETMKSSHGCSKSAMHVIESPVILEG